MLLAWISRFKSLNNLLSDYFTDKFAMTSEIVCRSTRSTSENKLFLSKTNKVIYTSLLEHSSPLVSSSIGKLDYIYSFKYNLSKYWQTQMVP